MSSLYNPKEMKARVDFPAGIISYRTKSDANKGDQHMWAIINHLDRQGITTYCGLMVRTESWQEEWYGKMYQAKFAIIMMSDSYWEPTSPCCAEVKAILKRDIPIFSIRVDDSCHTCMDGNFLGESVEQITAAGFLKSRLGSLNCFPPPHKPLFQDDFDANVAELVQMINSKLPSLALQPAADIGHGAASAVRSDEPAVEESAASVSPSAAPAADASESLASQLAAVKLSDYVEAIAEEGYDEVQFLVDADLEDIDEMLAAVKMKRPHEKTFRKWLAAQQSKAAEPSTGDLYVVKASGEVLTLVDIFDRGLNKADCHTVAEAAADGRLQLRKMLVGTKGKAQVLENALVAIQSTRAELEANGAAAAAEIDRQMAALRDVVLGALAERQGLLKGRLATELEARAAALTAQEGAVRERHVGQLRLCEGGVAAMEGDDLTVVRILPEALAELQSQAVELDLSPTCDPALPMELGLERAKSAVVGGIERLGMPQQGADEAWREALRARAAALAEADGARSLTVVQHPTGGGEVVAFEVATFGPQAAALAPTAAVLAAPLLADTALTNDAAIAGNVAVVQRGGDKLPFTARARRAQEAGAVAVIIVHDTSDTPVFFGDSKQLGGDITIPALCVGKADGERLLLGDAAVSFNFGSAADLEIKEIKAKLGAMEASEQAFEVGALRFGGFHPNDEATFGGRFTVDGATPTANGMPHYSNGSGGHLYYSPKTRKWFVTPSFTPETDETTASIATEGSVPVGDSTWRYYFSKQWGERVLTVTELSPTEADAVAAAVEKSDVKDLVKVTPGKLEWIVKVGEQPFKTMTLTNTSDEDIVFRFQVTNAERYHTAPPAAVILAGGSQEIMISLKKPKMDTLPDPGSLMDRFLILTAYHTPGFPTASDFRPSGGAPTELGRSV